MADLGKVLDRIGKTMSGTLDPEYRRQHYAVNRARGKAAEYQCVGCKGNAQEWAWVHGADRSDVFAYQPMCRSCHQKYDDHWSAEARAKVGQWSRERWRNASPELRERMKRK